MNKKRISELLITLLIFVIALGGYTYSSYKNRIIYKPRREKLESHYQIHSAKYLCMENIRPNASLYSNPTGRNIKKLGNISNASMDKSRLVTPSNIALAKNKVPYIKINQQGHSLGWVQANSLERTNYYKLPYIYYSQYWPSKADDACEIASLKTAMSTQGKGINVDLGEMVERIPRSENANLGYTHNPFKYGSHATINPSAMVKVAHLYGAKAKNITGANQHDIINDIKHGDAVICEGPYMAKKPSSDHDMVILGYKPGYFFVADPFAQTPYVRRSTWVSTSRLMSQYESPSRKQHALIIY